MTQNTNEVVHIVGTDLLDYSLKVEKAINEGYTFSDLTKYAPRSWSYMFEAWVLPKDKVTEDNTKKESTVKPPESPPIELSGASEGVDSHKEIKPVVEPSKVVTKRGKK